MNILHYYCVYYKIQWNRRYVHNCTKAIYFQVMKLLQKGNKERTQEPTAANKTSSRSHALLMVNVKQTAKSRAQTRGAVKFGRLYMIDLAGSERASQTEVF